MARKTFMSLGTINTILNTAPLIIQGATRLLKAIKEKNSMESKENDIPATVEGIKNELERVNKRLEDTSNTTIEQIRLIEELAKQNELLAESLQKLNRKSNLIALISIIAIFFVLLYLFLA